MEQIIEDLVELAESWKYDNSPKGLAAGLFLILKSRYKEDMLLPKLWVLEDEIREYSDRLAKELKVTREQVYKVLVCGDRNWNNTELVRQELEKCPKGTIVIEGECRGADIVARDIAMDLGFSVKGFPADWSGLGKKAGPIRNKKMLEESPDLVLAFHNDLESSKGTKHMVGLARKAGKKVVVITEREGQ